MRKSLLATAIGCGFALAMPAFAQTPAAPATPPPAVTAPAAPAAVVPPPAPPAPPPPEATAPPAAPAAAPAPAMKMEMKKPVARKTVAKKTESDVDSDKGAIIAPRLPSPKLGPDSGPGDYLKAAKAALKAKKYGEAQESLEMAETRALDRSTPVDTAGTPDSDPLVTDTKAALASLAKKDSKGADAAIDKAMGDPGAMDKPAPKADKPAAKPMHHKWAHPKPAAPAPAPADAPAK